MEAAKLIRLLALLAPIDHMISLHFLPPALIVERSALRGKWRSMPNHAGLNACPSMEPVR
jgi:hypothetical protein